jgi:hypothetical protein
MNITGILSLINFVFTVIWLFALIKIMKYVDKMKAENERLIIQRDLITSSMLVSMRNECIESENYELADKLNNSLKELGEHNVEITIAYKPNTPNQ